MLHTVNKSPFEKNALESCLKAMGEDCAVLLMEDGVIGATENSKSTLISELASKGRVYAMTPDLQARGIESKVLDGIQLIDYEGFVDLVVDHETTISWL